MLGNIGISGLVLLVIMAIVVFGPKKLPEIGKSFGKSLKEFRDATSGRPDSTDRDNNQNVQTFTGTSNPTTQSAVTPETKHSDEVDSTTIRQ